MIPVYFYFLFLFFLVIYYLFIFLPSLNFFYNNHYNFFMFRDVPGCSGMFRVPSFIDGPFVMVSHIAIVPTSFTLIFRFLKLQVHTKSFISYN